MTVHSQPRTCRRAAGTLAAALAALALGAGAPRPAHAAPAAAPGPKPKASALPARPSAGNVTIDRYRVLEWQPETNYFNSPEPVRMTFTDPVTQQSAVLTADDAEGSPTGAVKVRGRLLLVRPEGWLTGRSLTFEPASQKGSVLDARADIGGRIIAGKRIDLLGSTSLRASHATLTTCSAQNPDYRITARDLSIMANGSVRARDVSFWAGKTRLFVLPSFTRNFRHTVSSPFPLPTYSKDGGLEMRIGNEPISQPRTLLAYDLTMATRRPLQGSVLVEQDLGRPAREMDAPRTRSLGAEEPIRGLLAQHPMALRQAETQEVGPTRTSVYLIGSSNSAVTTPRRTDLQISRRPEAGIAFRNLLGRRRTQAASGASAPGGWLLNADLGMADYYERPTRVSASRASLHGEIATPALAIAPVLHARLGSSVWANAYGTGATYLLLAPEAEVEAMLRPDTAIGAGYRYVSASGRTPFLFDARSIRNEMRLWYHFLGAHWGCTLDLAADLERRAFYDTGVSVRRRLDCVEVGVSYKTRSQSIGIILNLLPGKASRPPAPPTGP